MNQLKKQSGFAPAIIILIVAIVIIAGGAGYYFYLSRDEVLQDKTLVDETVDWKVYRNEKYGFEVRYPKTWSAQEISSISSKAVYGFDEDGVPIKYIRFNSPDIGGEYLYYLTFGLKKKGEKVFLSDHTWQGLEESMKVGSKVMIGNKETKTYEYVEKGKVKAILYSDNIKKVTVEINGFEVRAELHIDESIGHLSGDEFDKIDFTTAPEFKTANQILSTFRFVELDEVKEGAPKVEVEEEEKPKSLIGKYSSPEKTFSFSIKAMEEGDVDAYLESFTEESQEALRGKVASDYLKRMAGLYKETEFKVIEKNSHMAVIAIMTLEKTILPGIFIFKKEKGDWKIDFKEQFFSSLYEEEIKKGPILHRLEEIKEEARSQARDGKRVADLMQLWSALELYYGQHAAYPALTDTSEDGVFLKILVDEGYFSQMFLDPQHPERYYEYNGTKESFILKGYIEEEGGIIDMKDGVKDNAYTITSPK